MFYIYINFKYIFKNNIHILGNENGENRPPVLGATVRLKQCK